ncbi:hypothetical protein [Sunxiuqinia sp. sy24]|uniref:hypothetical protein n=1 Tax=Sunxiuqinia sp. sy24 TaxID=3461495 RepID=UPI0040452FAF
MKKVTLALMTLFLVLLFLPDELRADAEPVTVPAETTTEVTVVSAEANARIDRLMEIKAMDVSTLTASEKRVLRKEVRTIRSEMKANGEARVADSRNGGIYLSAGGIIIVILLLVLLL